MGILILGFKHMSPGGSLMLSVIKTLSKIPLSIVNIHV
jgi:hypothetical protein